MAVRSRENKQREKLALHNKEGGRGQVDSNGVYQTELRNRWCLLRDAPTKASSRQKAGDCLRPVKGTVPRLAPVMTRKNMSQYLATCVQKALSRRRPGNFTGAPCQPRTSNIQSRG